MQSFAFCIYESLLRRCISCKFHCDPHSLLFAWTLTHTVNFFFNSVYRRLKRFRMWIWNPHCWDRSSALSLLRFIVEYTDSTAEFWLRNYCFVKRKWDLFNSWFLICGDILLRTLASCLFTHIRVVPSLLLHNQLSLNCFLDDCILLHLVLCAEEVRTSLVWDIVPRSDGFDFILNLIVFGERTRSLLSMWFDCLEFYRTHFHPMLVLLYTSLGVERWVSHLYFLR